MPEPTSTAAMRAFLDLTRQAADRQSLATDGFARAFIDATGLRPEDAEMIVEHVSVADHIGGGSHMQQRIWFQRRTR